MRSTPEVCLQEAKRSRQAVNVNLQALRKDVVGKILAAVTKDRKKLHGRYGFSVQFKSAEFSCIAL